LGPWEHKRERIPLQANWGKGWNIPRFGQDHVILVKYDLKFDLHHIVLSKLHKNDHDQVILTKFFFFLLIMT
jgi:hypothetical protein